jgi:hypothetical protein
VWMHYCQATTIGIAALIQAQFFNWTICNWKHAHQQSLTHAGFSDPSSCISDYHFLWWQLLSTPACCHHAYWRWYFFICMYAVSWQSLLSALTRQQRLTLLVWVQLVIPGT